MKPHSWWRLVTLIGLLAACGPSAAGTESPATSHETVPIETAPSSLPNAAFVSADGHLAVMRDGVMGTTLTGIVAADDKTVISTTTTEGSTTLSWIDLDDGTTTTSVDLAGDLRAMATDTTGRIVGLVSRDAAVGTSEIVIASSAGERFRKSYDSELQPEGFSNAYEGELPSGMFVIEFLDSPSPDASAPRRYRVRVLGPSGGELSLPLNLRDKGQFVDEEMLGFSRSHVISPANGLLFTLYRGVEADESNYAFVHTLGFVNGVWCLDLPSELALERLPGAVILVDGEQKLLVVSSNGFVTEFVIDDITNPEHLPVPRRTQVAWSTDTNSSAPALAQRDGQVLVGQGNTLRWIDAASLTGTVTQTVDIDIEAVALLADGEAVAAGAGRVAQISAAGQVGGTAQLPADLGAISRVLTFGA